MWRQFTAWIGGVGIIVLFLAVLPRLRIGGRQALFRQRSPGAPSRAGRHDPRQRPPLRRALHGHHRATRSLSLAITGWSGVYPRMDLFRAVAHSFAAVSTAGFSTEKRSVELFAPATQWAITSSWSSRARTSRCCSGAHPPHPAAFARDDEFRVYLAVVAVASPSSRSSCHREHLRRRGGGATRRLQRHDDDDDHRLRQRGLQQWTALTILVLFGVIMISVVGGVDQRVDQARPSQRDRADAAPRARPDAAPPPGRAAARQPAVVDERALRAIIVFVFLYIGVVWPGALVARSTLRCAAWR